MTACVNKKHTRRVALAISASLVGALSLGVAPTAALADDSIQTLEATPESSAEDGAIIEFADGAADGETFVANGKQQGLVPIKVQPWGTTSEDAQLDVSSYIVYKVVDANAQGAILESGRTIDGEPFYYTEKLTSTLPSEPGNYAVFAKVKVDGTEYSVKECATFSIASASLEDAVLYQVDSENVDDASDTDFTFNAAAWAITGKPKGEWGSLAGSNRLALKVGDVQLDMTNFTVEYYTESGTKLGSWKQIIAAGDYYAIVSGNQDSAYAGKKQRFDFTISPYDLASANIVAADVEWSAAGGDVTTDILSVDGVDFGSSWIKSYLTTSYPNVATSLGEASVTVGVNQEALKSIGGIDCTGSIINSQVVSYNVVSALVEPIATYDGAAFDSVDLKVDFSATPSGAFDASKVKVEYKDPKTGKTVSTDAYTLRVVNTETQEVGGADMLTQPGTYTVQAVLDSEALDWAVAGKSGLLNVTVTKGQISATDIAFSYKGDTVKTVNQLTTGLKYIPGVDVLDDITVSVKTANGEVPASDYKVVVTKTVDGKQVEVDSIEDAGEYRVAVVADGYTYDENESYINVTVDKRDLSEVSIRAKDTFNYTLYVKNEEGELVPEDHRVLPYTGDVITASYEWTCDGGKTWYDLPATDFSASYKGVNTGDDVMQAVDVYNGFLAADAKSVNYTGKGSVVNEVSDVRVYSDVPTTEWYAQSVYTATQLGYVKGMSGTSMFAPNADITRGDAVVILFRMAGADAYYEDASDTVINADLGEYMNDYSDVNASAHYAKAIAWATKMDIAHGDANADTFRPEDTITREEFAALLSNYARAMGEDIAVDTDEVLSEANGADTVSPWMRDAVAWAYANGVMGNNGASLDGQGNITRAQTAAMAVNYQPEGITDTLF